MKRSVWLEQIHDEESCSCLLWRAGGESGGIQILLRAMNVKPKNP